MGDASPKLYLYASGVQKHILTRCLRDDVRIGGYLYDGLEVPRDKVCEGNCHSVEVAHELVAGHGFAAVCSSFGEVVLRNKGVPGDRIIDISRRPERLSGSFDRFFCRAEQKKYLRWAEGGGSGVTPAERTELNRWHDECVLSCLRELGRRFYVVYDGCEHTDFAWLRERLGGADGFVGAIVADLEHGASWRDASAEYERLVYEDLGDSFVCLLCNRNRVRRVEGYLLDLGVPKRQLLMLDDVFYHAASKPLLEYDIHLGTVHRKERVPGFVTFGSGDKAGEDTFTILTLGGSTSDPTYGNLQSWSEALYQSLARQGANVVLYAGGVSAFTADHEWIKLIRDGLHLRPDLVISYSGFNNATTLTFAKEHPACRNVQLDFLRSILLCEDESVRDGWLYPLDNISCGLAYFGTLAEHWLECERVMHAVCEGFGIDFLAFLQPFNRVFAHEYGHDTLCAEVFGFYEELASGSWDEEWLVDFSRVFGRRDDMELFYDVCHTYERANRLVAKKMMPYVQRSMARRAAL